ncbi:MAG: hypothetical protein R3Y68_03430 [Rikenellaceae bacterium]
MKRIFHYLLGIVLCVSVQSCTEDSLEEGSGEAVPNAPTGFVATRDADDYRVLNFAWDEDEDASSYLIKCGSQVLAKDITTTTYTYSSAATTESVSYTIYAVNSVGYSTLSILVVGAENAPDAATGFEAVRDDQEEKIVIFTWDAIEGGASYELVNGDTVIVSCDEIADNAESYIHQDVVVDPDDGEVTIDTERLRYTYTDAITDSDVTYGLHIVERGVYSVAITAFVEAMPAPAAVSVFDSVRDANGTTIEFEWESVAFAESYEIWCDGVVVGTVVEEEGDETIERYFTYTEALVDVVQTYSLYAINSGGYSPAVEQTFTSLTPLSPADFAATRDTEESTKIEFTWSAATDDQYGAATSYTIMCGEESVATGITELSYSYVGTSDDSATFDIYAVNEYGTSKVSSSIVVYSLPSTLVDDCSSVLDSYTNYKSASVAYANLNTDKLDYSDNPSSLGASSTLIQIQTAASTSSAIYSVDGVVSKVSAELYYAIYTTYPNVNDGYVFVVSGSVDGESYTDIDTTKFDDTTHSGWLVGQIPGGQFVEVEIDPEIGYKYAKISVTSTITNANGAYTGAFLIDNISVDYINH